MINIATRLCPFSHTPGSAALIPGTQLAVRAYPHLIVLEDWRGVEPQVLQKIDFPGSADNFVLILDLEKKQVRVAGKRLIWAFWASPEGVWVSKNKEMELIQPQKLDIHPGKSDRLSLGSHRKQEWEKMVRYPDLETLLPIWMKMGELLPEIFQKGPASGTVELLQQLKSTTDKQEIIKTVIALIKGGFKSLMAPALSDDNYLGLCPHYNPQTETSPLILLKEGAEFIKSLFIREDSAIHLLPQLPHIFVSGRMSDVTTRSLQLSFLWKKKRVQKVVIKAMQSDEITLQFTPSISRCRISTASHKRGEVRSLEKPLVVESGKTYFLDRLH